MKATIEFDDALYRRLKVEAARRGRTVRDLVAEAVTRALDIPPESPTGARNASRPDDPRPVWFASLDGYARAVESHDTAAIRASIARGRAAEAPK